MNARARIYIGLVIAAGLLVLAFSIIRWESPNSLRFGTYIVLAILSGSLKIRFPGFPVTLSGGFLIVLLSVRLLTISETVVIAITSVLVQYAWHSSARLRLVQAAFNASSAAIAAFSASMVFHAPALFHTGVEEPLRLAIASMVYFCGSLIVAVVVTLTENKSFQQVTRDYYLWSVPFYLFAAAIVEVIAQIERLMGWQTAVLVAPAVYALYQVWAVYVERVEQERKRQEEARIHAEEMSALHVRTIHALAMAIEARDRTTHDHLQRVQIYAVEIGRRLGLDRNELEALRTASVLHDIGKLGVPEHIISKPGRLTPEEFAKVQAHPALGAEILERVHFPYGVVPIVRCHHERWDGSGYPDGLKGSDIPVGARILSVVDCFDALASDRQYRKAMPADKVIETIRQRAGKDFDPRVVEMLAEQYPELEDMVRAASAAEPVELPPLSIREAVPAAGFQSAILSEEKNYDVVALLRRLVAASDATGGNVGLADLLSVADRELRSVLGYELLGFFAREGGRFRLVYLTGLVPGEDKATGNVGEGLSGWVIEEGRPILNGNGRLDRLIQLNTGLAEFVTASSVPVLHGDRTVGAVTIYSRRLDAFAARDLQVLWAVSAELGVKLMEGGRKPSLQPVRS